MTGFNILGNTSSPFFWAAWSLALVWQNYAFTRVSRARNSGSLKAHALAAVQSNGVWFLQSLFVYSAFMNILTGKAGIVKAIGAALYYTVFTMAGSIYAHYVSLKKEKGASAVGANKKYAQIPVAEWAQLQQDLINVASLGKKTLEVLETLPNKEDYAAVNERVNTILSNTDAAIKDANEKFQRVSDIAHQAYDITVGLIPDAGIKAQKFDGATIVTGMPQKG